MIGAISGPKGAVELLLPRLFSFCGPATTKREHDGGILLGWGAAVERDGVMLESTIGAASLGEDGNSATLRFERGSLRMGRGSHSAPPLYFAHQANGVVVALSRWSPLAQTCRAQDVDDAWLASALLSFSFPIASRTACHAIGRVPDRSWVRIGDARAPSVERWPLPRLPQRQGTPTELAEALWEEIRMSVACATRGHQRVAVMVGGGVDSSGVLAAVVAESKGASAKEVSAIALDFDGPGSDQPHLAALCRELGIVPVRKSPSVAGPYVGKTFVLDGLPYPNLAGPWFVMMGNEAKERGATVVLSGENGDAALTGDPRTFSRRFISGHPFDAIWGAYRFTKPFAQSRLRNVRDYVFRPLAKRMVPSPLLESRRRRRRTGYAPWLGNAAKDFVRSAEPSNLSMVTTAEQRYERLVAPAAGADYATMRLQLEAATGVPIAEVFCDDRLMRFVAGIDPRDLLFGDQERGLYRLALRGEVPESVRLRTDKAEYLPAMVETVAAAGGASTLGNLATMRKSEARGLVNAARFQEEFAMLVQNPSMSIRKWGELWPALSVEAFLRENA